MINNFALLDFSTAELVIILAILLLLFGGKKLPEISRSLIKSKQELQKGLYNGEDKQKTQTDKSGQA